MRRTLADDEATRTMFRNLYDESQDLAARVDAFKTTSEEMRSKYDAGTWRNHYQNTNAISTYLWLMYPDKYYIYKYELFRAAAKELESEADIRCMMRSVKLLRRMQIWQI